ncbi:MAG: cation-translocating P-type ATPase, partial [Firmicutes bacterium]|nr:cation-translocating P-type ATPase [Bacillota bacterium]
VISDEVRTEARASVSELREAGVHVVMITGDGEQTAKAIARRVGIITKEHDTVITGAELASMSDNEVKAILTSLAVVSRALPSDKLRLVTLSEESGLVVGMTGDGVNDAPALKAADVGFALGGGTEVAREAGDIVILDDNIKSIGNAVLYGRTIFDSIRKFIVFQLTMNLSAVGVSVIGPFLGIEAPVTVIQMLWVNMIMDTLGGLAFAGEAPRHEFMKDPPKRRDEGILSVSMVRHIVISGVFTTIMSISYLKLPFFRERFDADGDYLRFITVFFAFFVFAGIFTAFNCRTDRMNILSRLSKNHAFIFIMTATCVVQLLIVYFGGDVFRTTPLYPNDIAFALTLAFTVVPFDMIRKALIK